MIRHKYLNSVGNHNFRIFYAAFFNIVKLLYKVGNIESNTCSDNVYRIFIKHSGWHLVKGKFTVIIDYSMSRIASSLKSDNYISIGSKQVSYLTFSFIAPVSSYYCFYHVDHSYLIYNNKINLHFIISYTYTKVK